jgi:hypothetical protein
MAVLVVCIDRRRRLYAVCMSYLVYYPGLLDVPRHRMSFTVTGEPSSLVGCAASQAKNARPGLSGRVIFTRPLRVVSAGPLNPLNFRSRITISTLLFHPKLSRAVDEMLSACAACGCGHCHGLES